MFLKTDVFFDNHIPEFNALLIRAETAIPAEYVRLYKKNVVAITPLKSGALRRSIITRQLGGRAEISWRSTYAGAQNQGGHTQSHFVRGANQRDGGFGIIKPGSYIYSKYTTPGTGPHFANIAFQATNAQMPAVLKELGLSE